MQDIQYYSLFVLLSFNQLDGSAKTIKGVSGSSLSPFRPIAVVTTLIENTIEPIQPGTTPSTHDNDPITTGNQPSSSTDQPTDHHDNNPTSVNTDLNPPDVEQQTGRIDYRVANPGQIDRFDNFGGRRVQIENFIPGEDLLVIEAPESLKVKAKGNDVVLKNPADNLHITLLGMQIDAFTLDQVIA